VSSLDGLRIVVTRAAHQAEELARHLREHGATVVLLPMIEIVPPEDEGPLREAAAQCDAYDWIVFTSANAVRAFAAELPPEGLETKARIAVIGTATREAAEGVGLRVTLMPEKFVGEALRDAFANEDLNDKRVLIPSAAVARDLLPDALRELGARVEVVGAYRSAVPKNAEQRARGVFQEPFPDWVTFASPSAVNYLQPLVGTAALSRVKIAVIGPVTAEAVRRYGLAPTAEAALQTGEGLVRAILEKN